MDEDQIRRQTSRQVEYDDARVFLDRSAVAALRDRRLDVALGNDGRWHFQCPTRS